MYADIFTDSWKRLKFPLFVPDLIFLLTSILIGYVLFRSVSFGDLSSAEGIQTFVTSLVSQSSSLIRMIVAFVIFIIVTFFLGAGALSWKYVMIRDVIKGKRVDAFKYFMKSGEFVWSVVLLKLLVFSIYVVSLLVIGLLFLLVSDSFQNLGALLGFGFLAGVIGLFYSLMLFFRYPILFFDVKNPVDALKKSFFVAKNNFEVLIVTIIILVGINFGFGIIFNIISLIIGESFPSIFVIILLGLIPKVWGDLFLFDVYNRIKR